MSDVSTETAPHQPGQGDTTWSTARTFTLAIVCLLLGTVVGYVLHGPSSAQAAVPAAVAQNAPAPTPAAMPTDEQMKHMAEKTAEPLLAKLEKDPNDAEALAKVGRAYLLARQFDKAAEYYERSARSKPSADTFTTLGGVYHYAGQNDKALASWQHALELDPKHADALVNIGLVKWREQSDVNGAVAAWKQMLKGNPNHPQRAVVERMIAEAQKHSSMMNPTQK